MAHTAQQQFEQELEQYIDQTSLPTVLEALVTICFEKADHVRTNWQDESLARSWYADGKAIEKIVARIQNR